MAGSHLGRSVVIVARPPPPIMVLVVVAHRSPRLWGDTIVTTTTIGRRVTITINHYHHHYHDHPISILIAVPPTQEGRTSTGWKFPLKSFWLRSPAPRQSSPWHLKINGATPNVKFSFSQLLAQVPENAWRNSRWRCWAQPLVFRGGIWVFKY